LRRRPRSGSTDNACHAIHIVYQCWPCHPVHGVPVLATSSTTLGYGARHLIHHVAYWCSPHPPLIASTTHVIHDITSQDGMFTALRPYSEGEAATAAAELEKVQAHNDRCVEETRKLQVMVTDPQHAADIARLMVGPARRWVDWWSRLIGLGRLMCTDWLIWPGRYCSPRHRMTFQPERRQIMVPVIGQFLRNYVDLLA
jgi:hypothetical protein